MKSNAQKQFQHFALDINDNIIDIRKTADFESQNYYCPHCHNEMITRRGNIRQWHFAHKADKCSYDKYLHSIAEIMIMEWFNKKNSIMLGLENDLKCDKFDSCVYFNFLHCKATEKQQYDLKKYYSKCIKEYGYGGFISDLYCENNTKPNSPIFIEIFVTHKCTQDKINSGIRIIELKIQSEEDIINIINSNILKEGDKVKLYNFKRKEFLVDNLQQDFQKYILYPSLKDYVDKKNFTCRNYAQYRKGIYEISLPYDDYIPNFINGGGLYMVGRVKAYLEGYFKKNCQLCMWQVEDVYDNKICKLYKRCGNPKYCKENDASKCSMFKEDRNTINNAISDFNEYLKNGNVDIWKAEK
jgi:predicted RNA-binding Zn-ribbon protein involved in translation (DUF1610 family)